MAPFSIKCLEIPAGDLFQFVVSITITYRVFLLYGVVSGGRFTE